MIALTQARGWAPARDYIARRTSEGKTRREEMRALKRFLVRAVWRIWQRTLPTAVQTDKECFAAAPVLLSAAS